MCTHTPPARPPALQHNYLHYMDGPYVAGNYEFDPLNLYSALGDDAAGRRAMRELEVGTVVHGKTRPGRLASVALKKSSHSENTPV